MGDNSKLNRKNSFLVMFIFFLVLGVSIVFAFFMFNEYGLFASAGCDQLKDDINSYIDSHKSCEVTEDCQMVRGYGCFFGLVGNDADMSYITELRTKINECMPEVAYECFDPWENKTMACEDNQCILRKYSELNDVEECFTTPNGKDCINYLARATNDHKHCYQITDELIGMDNYESAKRQRIECLLNFVEEDGCGILPVDTYERENCFLDRALATENSSLCYYAGGKIGKCFSEFALVEEDETICDKIEQASMRNNCYYHYEQRIQ